jgi:hypothetical protein
MIIKYKGDDDLKKTIYGIFSGAYSDWQIHGYMTNRDEAEKYCALKNSKNNYGWNQYYVVDINHIYTDVKDIKLKYYHTVTFDFDIGMRNEPYRYNYYVGEDRKPYAKYNTFKDGSGWVSFSFNCEDREKAEKIAQDKYFQFLAYKSEFGIEKAAELMNIKKV